MLSRFALVVVFGRGFGEKRVELSEIILILDAMGIPLSELE